MNKKTFYITTPIYYVNSAPHIGSAYTTLAADVLTRWHSLLGEKVFFLTGTDEHGKKIQQIAAENNLLPQQLADDVSKKFKEAWKILDIQYDNFIRTTDDYHQDEVQDILQKLYDQEYIYKGNYESYYCTGCEQYLNKRDLIEGNCQIHKTQPELKKEEAYLFKLSAFQKRIEQAIKTNEMLILPQKRKNEVLSFIQEGLQDISISRKKSDVSWGIPLPFDEEHTTYVWIDAFWNYISGLKTQENKNTFWPANIQLMANDILRVHATIWPAMLLALKIPLPQMLFIHGYFTVDGQKMSKSAKNSIDPILLSKEYSTDSLRYFIFRSIPFGEDGDFSITAFTDRHNNELANKLGNLVSRVSTLAEKYGLEKTQPLEEEDLLKKVDSYLQTLALDKALNEIFAYIDKCNEYIQEKKPWDTQDKKVLWQLSNSIKTIAILLSPFMPQTSEKIAEAFHFKISLDSLNEPLKIEKIQKVQPLFIKKEQKIIQTSPSEKKVEESKSNQDSSIQKNPIINTNITPNLNNSQKPIVQSQSAKISYDEFAKVQLKIGKILDAIDHPKADKLLVLTVDLGEEKPRTIVAGLKKAYSKEYLKGKKAVFVTNLQPANLRGIESNGMILASSTLDDSQIFFLQPEKDIKEGSKVR